MDRFKAAMAADGIVTNDPIEPDLPPGRFNRFHIKGDKPRSKRGWCRLNTNGFPAGRYGRWDRDRFKNNWRWDGPKPKGTDPATWKKQMADAERQQREDEATRHERVRLRAQRIWEHAQPEPTDHPYFARM